MLNKRKTRQSINLFKKSDPIEENPAENPEIGSNLDKKFEVFSNAVIDPETINAKTPGKEGKENKVTIDQHFDS